MEDNMALVKHHPQNAVAVSDTESRYREIIAANEVVPLNGSSENQILQKFFHGDMVGRHLTASEFKGFNKQQFVITSIEKVEKKDCAQIRLTMAHIIPGFTTTKLTGWLTEVKQRLSQSVSRLFKRLKIPLDVSVFVDYLLSRLTTMASFSTVSITEETLTVTEHTTPSGKIQLSLSDDDLKEDNIGFLEALIEGKVELVNNQLYPQTTDDKQAAIERLTDLTGTRFYDEIENVAQLVVTECFLDETLKPRSAVKRFSGILASLLFSDSTQSLCGKKALSSSVSATRDVISEAILKKGTKLGVKVALKSVAKDNALAVLISGGLLFLKTLFSHFAFKAGDITGRMFGREFVRNLSSEGGSLIGSVAGGLVGFFTLGPLGAMGLGALGGLIGAIASKIVCRFGIKSSRLALWIEKKVRANDQKRQKASAALTHIPALTAA